MSDSDNISAQIADLKDWRGEQYAMLRALVMHANPDITEEWKWGTAVWTHNGNVCAVGAFKDHIKLNFFQGASLPDSTGLFNVGLNAKATRAIDIHRGDTINEPALTALIHAAIAYNLRKVVK